MNRPFRVAAKAAAVLLLLLSFSSASLAQAPAAVDDARKREVVTKLSQLLRENYVFPDVGNKAAALITSQLAAGAYKSASDPVAFAEALTRDLQSVTRDKHLRVQPRPPQPVAAAGQPSPEQRQQQFRKRAVRSNYEFEKVEILPGNVGYLKLNGFVPAQFSGPTATAAMNFLANSDAIIFDLRDNGGGDPTLIQLLSSYLFDEPTHLNSLYWRRGDRTDQFWTLPYVQGTRLARVPVFVLTSGRTFSGGEEFANNLKMLKRGTIIGETTGGGANPGEGMDIAEGFGVFIPTGRAINPISKTNWEGVGVEPDVKVPAAEALNRAHLLAMEKIAAASSDPETQALAKWTTVGLQARLSPPRIAADQLSRYAGKYGPRSITVEGERLFYQREGRPKQPLRALTNDTFGLEEQDFFRVQFVSDASGRIVALRAMYDDGRTEENRREN